MATRYYDISMAFAGMTQAAYLVHELAYQGRCDASAYKTSLQSLLITSPKTTVSVFGEAANIKLGLTHLLQLFNPPLQKNDLMIMRYCTNLMLLERKLSAHPDALAALSERLADVERQLGFFDITSETIVSALADIYVDIISPLANKIQIYGNADVLQHSLIQAKIRALLLAGIRATVLWRQVGGARWQLIFFRRRMVEQTLTIINHL